MLGTLALSGFFTYEVCRKLDPTLPLVSMRGGEGRGGEGRGGEGRRGRFSDSHIRKSRFSYNNTLCLP